MSLLGLVGVRIIPVLEQTFGPLLAGTEKLIVDVGRSDHPRWNVTAQLHTASTPSPLIMPRNAYGVVRAVNPHELVLELRKLADAIERHL